jgi:hypothetical protein
MPTLLPASLSQQASSIEDHSATAASPQASLYAQPFARQLVECTRKLLTAYWRMPAYNFTRLCMTVVVALVFGFMYMGVGSSNNAPCDHSGL